MAEKKEETKKERLISIFDPTVGAYRELPESLVKKFIESAKEAEKKIKEKEK